MRYDDLDYCVGLINKGQYPKIHDDIFTLARFIDATTVIDLGCCHGLLSHRLGTVYNRVIGIEASTKYLENVIPRDNVIYVQLRIDTDTLPNLKRIIIENGVGAIFARRVVPEIWETGGDALCAEFAKTLYESGIRQIALEGRKPTKNPRNRLHSADKECEVFAGMYRVAERYKGCRLLERM